jgi:hypothetical protein
VLRERREDLDGGFGGTRGGDRLRGERWSGSGGIAEEGEEVERSRSLFCDCLTGGLRKASVFCSYKGQGDSLVRWIRRRVLWER